METIPRFINRLFCSLLFLLTVNSVSGTIILPSVLSDHMVLQQFSWVNFWGRADPGEAITVYTSWNDKSYSVTTDRNGKWIIKLFTGGAGGPFNISFTGINKVELKDVMLGEVWICSGQSNMEFTFKDLGGWKYYPGLKKQIETTDLHKIRLCTVQKHISQVPSDSCNSNWQAADSSSILNFSASAFYFGLEIYNKFFVPVGLIVSSWGGTPAEAWTPEESLKYTPGLSYYLRHPNDPMSEATAPSVLFNGMIYPLRYYTIKGFIWYQGESNRYDCDLYGALFKSMIKSWRKYWEKPDLPFYFVQIAPYDYADYDEASGYLREAQEKALELENTGMAVTLDIGNLNNIHPKNKQDVGHRLALLAFANTYSLTDLKSYSSPAYRFSRIEGDRIQVYFKNTDMLDGKGRRLSGFRIAGSDGIFKPADAVISGSSVMVTCKEVPSPRYVRYAFRNTDTASVFDKWRLPAGSFRTDSLPVNYRQVNISAVFNALLKNWSVSLDCYDPSVLIRYTADGSLPSLRSAIYSRTLTIDTSCTLRARAFLQGVASQSSSALHVVSHEATGTKVVLVNKPSEKYKGYDYTLTDGIKGSTDFHDGRWLGFQSQDINAILDLGKEIPVSSIRVSFLVNTSSYIFPPVRVDIYTSVNGRKFEKAGEFKPKAPEPSSLIAAPEILEISSGAIKGLVKFIKIVAKNQNTNPPWHYAPGQKCWLFVDEIECRK